MPETTTEREGRVSRLQVNSFDELIQHEQEILERIAEMQNGGNLFLSHPFMLFKDIGVDLSEEARIEIMRHEPHLTALSETAYNALKESQEDQDIQVEVRGLFQRRET